jgi:hypothetical protein
MRSASVSTRTKIGLWTKSESKKRMKKEKSKKNTKALHSSSFSHHFYPGVLTFSFFLKIIADFPPTIHKIKQILQEIMIIPFLFGNTGEKERKINRLEKL